MKCKRCEKNRTLRLKGLPLFEDIRMIYPYCADCITPVELTSYERVTNHRVFVEITKGIEESEKESTHISELQLLYTNS